MTYSVTATVSWEATTTDEVKAEVESWGVPEGAVISINAAEQLASGISEGGDIVEPSPESAPGLFPPGDPPDLPPVE
jgi:hypothetical protein